MRRAEELGAFLERHERETVRHGTRLHGADELHLLDLAVDLLETVPGREREGPVVPAVDVRGRGAEAERLEMSSAVVQQRRAEPATPSLGQDTWREEAAVGRVGRPREAGANDRALELGEEVETTPVAS